MGNLAKLREQLRKDQSINLLDANGNTTDDIVGASKLALSDGEQLSLDEKTDFQVEDTPITLRTVYNCWIHKDSSAAEYLADCQAKGLTNISFLQRTDLINWLSGQSESSQFISVAGKDHEKSESAVVKEKEEDTIKDPVLQEALAHERVLLDHNSCLRGTKPTNFGYLIKEAELKLVHSLKSSRRPQKTGERAGVSKTSSKTPAKKDPIILIPSAASSIFTIANIKRFLEESVYVHPRDMPPAQSDVTSVVKKFDRFGKPIKFLIVNNTRLFTKPEYWDRVVAVFTTGHAWQFSNYQWSTPTELFQHCRGYYFYFAGDVVPHHVEQWNVQKVELEKNKRFRDVEVLRYFWNSMEKELVARGYR